MKTVGERIKQARLHRKMSQGALALKVGYSTQSGIANLENRGVTKGGFKLSEVACALDVSLDWLMRGPDVADMSLVGPYNEAGTQPQLSAPAPLTPRVEAERSMVYSLAVAQTQAERAVAIVKRLPPEGLTEALIMLQLIEAKHAAQAASAGVPVPAH